MSRGRPRHHGSRRRAYSGRQREVRERQSRLARQDEAWSAEPWLTEADDESATDGDRPLWTLRLQGRPSAA